MLQLLFGDTSVSVKDLLFDRADQLFLEIWAEILRRLGSALGWHLQGHDMAVLRRRSIGIPCVFEVSFPCHLEKSCRDESSRTGT